MSPKKPQKAANFFPQSKGKTHTHTHVEGKQTERKITFFLMFLAENMFNNLIYGIFMSLLFFVSSFAAWNKTLACFLIATMKSRKAQNTFSLPGDDHSFRSHRVDRPSVESRAKAAELGGRFTYLHFHNSCRCRKRSALIVSCGYEMFV